MKVTWIGNKNKLELHRVEAGKPQPAGCEFDEIPEEHRVKFKTAKAALHKPKPKWDACFYCTKRFKSRR